MITAIIVNYHSHALTARAAASVLADQPEAQVIVVDNSESESEAQALRAALPSPVECIITPENIGFGRACNVGFSRARHDLILLLNPDAFVLQGCIGAMTDFLAKTPHAGAVCPLVYWDAELTWLAPPILMHTPFTEAGMALLLRWPWLADKVSRLFRRWALNCIGSDRPVERRMLSGGHILLRREAIAAAGGLFDPHFFMYFEDTDLCRRLRLSGSRLYILPAARAVHEWCCTLDKGEISATSHQYYFNKHFPKSRLLAVRRQLERSRLGLRLPQGNDLGVCRTPPALPVPASLQEEWVLELSPQPLLIPALYYFGNGPEARISEPLWQRLGPGQYWARIAAPQGVDAQWFCWRIENE
jgi:GT2 family glycosyltransferase